jgi:hypothetical protein
MSLLEYLAQSRFFDKSVAEVVYKALHRRKELHNALAGNPCLSDSLWELMYNTNSTTKIAKLLVGRPLNNLQVKKVLSMEKRDSVLSSCISANTITDEEVEFIGDNLKKGQTAAAISAKITVSERIRISLLPELGLIERLILAGDPKINVSDKVVESWFPKSVLDQAVRSKSIQSSGYALLIYKRKSIVKMLISSGNSSAIIAVASSPAAEDGINGKLLDSIMNLGIDDRKYALMAYSANPRIDPATLKKLVIDHRLTPIEKSQINETINRRRNDDLIINYDDAESPILNQILRRAMPSEYRPDGRPAELLAIIANPALGTDFLRVQEALESLERHKVWGPTIKSYFNKVEVLSNEENGEEFYKNNHILLSASESGLHHYQPTQIPEWLYSEFKTLAIEKLGSDANAWETLVSLFDSFTGSAYDLIEIAPSL